MATSTMSFAVAILIASLFQFSEAQNDVNEVYSFFNYTDLDTWSPPPEMYKDLPYYHAGYDYEGRPVVVIEVGRWNSSKYFQGDKEMEALHWKYCEQMWYRCYPETKFFDSTANGIFAILDMENWSLRQFQNPRIVLQYLRSGFLAGKIYDPSVSVAVGLNVNYAAHTMFDLVKPFVGEAFSGLELFGNNKERYVPRLLKGIPRDQLPTWYGGVKGFKPVRVFP